jgi:short-subunit dehydrogenase
MLLKGMVVMITGGAAGVGAACARQFQARGSRLSINDLNAPVGPETDRYLFTQGDIREDSVRRLFLQRTLEKFGRVDILVNNAGVGIYAPAFVTDLDEARSMFELNVFAPLGMSQLAIPHFRRQRSGLVINIGSVGGLVTLPWSTLYCASKYALHSVSDGLRRELRGSGVRVMTVIPGIVATQFREHVISGTVPEGVGSQKKIIAPDDLAKSIVNAATKGKTVVYNPQIGRLFAFIDRFFPFVMDRFIDKQWDPNLSANEWKEA